MRAFARHEKSLLQEAVNPTVDFTASRKQMSALRAAAQPPNNFFLVLFFD